MINKLLHYQEVDAQLRQIEVDLSASEERRKALSAKKFLDGVEEAISKLDKRAEELGISFSNAQARTKKLKEQEADLGNALESLEDETEATYLLKKADELLNKIRLLETETGKVSEDMQAVMEEYNNVRVKIKAAQAQYNEYGQKYNKLKADRQKERDGIENELKTLEKAIDPALMAKYNTKRKDKIYPILFKMQGNVCGNCRMEISMAEMSRLKGGNVIECENCHRLIYKDEK